MNEKLKLVINQPPSEITSEQVVFAATGMSITELVEDMHNHPDKYAEVLTPT